VAGDADAVDKGFQCFDKLLTIDTVNFVALALRGSGCVRVILVAAK
jgi:hypothetical protein